PAVTLNLGDEAALARRMDHPGLIGFLVVEGLLMREIVLAGSVAAELIGAGDVRASDLSPLNGRLCWTVLQTAELAVLDGIFTSRAAEWPQIFGRIALRAVAEPRARAEPRHLAPGAHRGSAAAPVLASRPTLGTCLSRRCAPRFATH